MTRARRRSPLSKTRAAGVGSTKPTLAATRVEHEALARELRSREHDLAGLAARLRSLEELDASRAGFGDAARVVLAQANGAVNQLGAVADYLDVDRRYERAVEASPRRAAPARRRADARARGRWPRPRAGTRRRAVRLPRARGQCGCARRREPRGRAAAALERGARQRRTRRGSVAATLFGNAWIAESYDEAVGVATRTGGVAATPQGDVVRGGRLVTGGTRNRVPRAFSRRRARFASCASGSPPIARPRRRLRSVSPPLEAAIADAQRAIESALHDVHHHEKALVGHDAQIARANEEATRLARKAELLALDRRRAEQEGSVLDQRQAEARESIATLEIQQREADERFTSAQSRLAAARVAAEHLGHRVAEARAVHAAPHGTRRIARRRRAAARGCRTGARRAAWAPAPRAGAEGRQRVALAAAIDEGLRLLDDDVRALDRLRADVHEAEATSADAARGSATRRRPTYVRRVAPSIRFEPRPPSSRWRARLRKAISPTWRRKCAEMVQASLDEVLAEVEQLERRRRGGARRAGHRGGRGRGSERRNGRRRRSRRDASRRHDRAARGRARRRGGGRPGPSGQPDGRRGDRRPASEDRPPRPGEHDGHRAARGARDPPHVPHDPEEGPRRFDRANRARRSAASTRRRRPGSGRPSPRSTRTSRRRSARSSAAGAPASRCSTRAIPSRAASTSSPRLRASGSRASSCSRAARRRSRLSR